MKPFFIILGLFLLFSSSYIDNLRGPLLPVLSTVFGLNYSDISLFLVLGNLGAVAATFGLLFMNQKMRERPLVLGVVLFASLSCLLSLFIRDKILLFVFAVCLGASIVLLGSLANLMAIRGTDARWRTPVFCGLHMMYGVGSLTGPLLLAEIPLGQGFWQLMLLAIPVLGFLSLPLLFKKLGKVVETRPGVLPTVSLNRFQVFILVIFATYVIGEVMTSMWMVTYLIANSQMTVTSASPYLSGFFLMMSLSRAALFFSFQESREKTILFVFLVLSFCFYLWGMSGNPWGFVLTGVFGPFFPVFLARLGRVYPQQVNSITLWVICAVQIAQMVGHQMMGWVADWRGIQEAYWIPGGFLFFTLILLFFYFRGEEKRLTR